MVIFQNSSKGRGIVISKKKSIWSATLSIIGIMLFAVSYLVSENPTSGEQIVIKVFFFSGIASMIAGIVFSVLAYKAMETGFQKYISYLIVFLLIIRISLEPILMALFGFGD
ncbi:hypothetical protein [Peribacillus frigoritolerans]|uniref:hypothetical protein n=1 Tax=Peribacillus frigoritolerans TaxID=450367 RepID=UPI002EA6F556|nr:hypothetical protein [Peribacillus frigoritolerans]